MRSSTNTIKLLKEIGVHVHITPIERPLVTRRTRKFPALNKQIPGEGLGEHVRNEQVMEMRAIKHRYMLRSIDLVSLLSEMGFRISRNSLQQILQGNIKGTDRRTFNSKKKYSKKFRNAKGLGLSEVHKLFKEIEQKMQVKAGHLINRDMKEIMDGWCGSLGIAQGDKPRRLAELIGLNQSTWFNYYRENRYPKSIVLLLDADQKVNIATKNMKGIKK